MNGEVAFTISTSRDLNKLIKYMKAVAENQLPYALALTLTWTAKEMQERIRQRLPEYFTMRGTWVEKSIRIDPARKGPHPVARVGSVYGPMALQATGGEKGGKDGEVAVPVWARRIKTIKTMPSKWPGALTKKSNFFAAPFMTGPFRVGKGAEGGDGYGVFQRIGKKRDRKHLRLWWATEPTVHVEPRWPFQDIGQKTVSATLIPNFFAAMERAMATARK